MASGSKKDKRPSGGIWDSESEHLLGVLSWKTNIPALIQIEKWTNLTAEMLDISGQYWGHPTAGEVLRVHSILTSQWIALVRSAHLLNVFGRTGPAMSLMRSIYETTDLINHIMLTPEAAAEWSRTLGAPPGSPEQIEGRNLFNWRDVRKAVRKRGGVATPEKLVNELNLAVHPTEWGVSSYGIRKPGSNQVGISAHVGFNPQTTYRSLSHLRAVLPTPVHAFLQQCLGYKIKKSAWRKIKANFDELHEYWEGNNWVSDRMLELMNETDVRLRAGEEFETVKADIESRFED